MPLALIAAPLFVGARAALPPWLAALIGLIVYGIWLGIELQHRVCLLPDAVKVIGPFSERIYPVGSIVALDIGVASFPAIGIKGFDQIVIITQGKTIVCPALLCWFRSEYRTRFSELDAWARSNGIAKSDRYIRWETKYLYEASGV